jgi:cytidylate kinase
MFRHPDRPLLITIDGPAGAGKTTVSKLLAVRLGYRYLDTGALYRGVARAAQTAGIAADDDNALADLCSRINLDLEEGDNGLRLLLDGLDITDQIRTPEISMLASAVSARPVVRTFLLQTQRVLGLKKKAVVEGRDMGTVVFPDADVKFYLSADPRIRARRRFAELSGGAASGITLQDVEKDLRRRDYDDSTRAVAPLRPAADAVHIDATHLGIDEVVETMLDHISQKVSHDEP